MPPIRLQPSQSHGMRIIVALNATTFPLRPGAHGGAPPVTSGPSAIGTTSHSKAITAQPPQSPAESLLRPASPPPSSPPPPPRIRQSPGGPGRRSATRIAALPLLRPSRPRRRRRRRACCGRTHSSSRNPNGAGRPLVRTRNDLKAAGPALSTPASPVPRPAPSRPVPPRPALPGLPRALALHPAGPRPAPVLTANGGGGATAPQGGRPGPGPFQTRD